jgi:SnoaL-like domain
MSELHDRDELVELMSRYAIMPDTQNWDELPRSVFCDEFTCDFSSLGAPVTTFSRDAWCQRDDDRHRQRHRQCAIAKDSPRFTLTVA